MLCESAKRKEDSGQIAVGRDLIKGGEQWMRGGGNEQPRCEGERADWMGSRQ